MRHDLVHKGVMPAFNPPFQRYMQLLFVDIAAFTLGIRADPLLPSYVEDTGFDVSFAPAEPEKATPSNDQPMGREEATAVHDAYRRSWIDLLERLGQ